MAENAPLAAIAIVKGDIGLGEQASCDDDDSVGNNHLSWLSLRR